MSGHRPPPDTPAQTPGGGWGPTVTGGRERGRRRWPWVLVALLLLPGLLGGGLLVYASGRIERVAVEGRRAGDGPLHVLVVGSDSREDLTAEQRRELSTGSAGGERTDTIFLLTVDDGAVGMLAFPRDLWVTLCDGSRNRINAAQAIGGPGCLVRTVTELSGIPIDHYLSVSFLGFRDIVDAAGGVRLCLDRAIQDDDAGIDLPSGCQTLSGPQALGYVRVRKIDSDLERIQRQQRFLGALADRLASPGTLLNPVRLFGTVGQIADALTADPDLGALGLLRLGWAGRSLAGGAPVTATVPTSPATVGGASVLVAREDEAAALFRRFRDGSVLAEAGSDAPPRSEITVRVLNGAGVPDLAGQTAERLRRAGYQVSGIGNAGTTSRTVIRHGPEAQAAAEVLAADLPVEPTLRETVSGTTLVLVLGADAAG